MSVSRTVLVLSMGLVTSPAVANDDLSLDALLGMKVTTASKKAERLEDAPGVMSVITKDDIAAYGRRDLFEVLELVVGASESQNFLYPRNFVGVRGEDSFRANHVLYLLNGRPLRRSVDGGYVFPLLKSFPVEAVERIEVIRGPGSVLYGSTAYQGVINIITTTPSEPEATASVGYGSWNTLRGRATAGVSHKSGLTVLGGISGVTSDGYEVVQPDSEGTDGSFSRYADDLGGTVQIGFKGLTVNWAGAMGTAPSFGSNAEYFNEKEYDHQRAMLDVGYGVDLSDWISLQTNMTWNHAVQNEDDTEIVSVAADLLHGASSTAKSNDYLVEASVYMTPHERVNVLVGTSVERQTGYWLIGNPDKPGVNTGLLPPYAEQWGAVFSQADWRPVDNVKLVTGFQANKAGDVPWDVVPRLGVVAHANDNVGFKVLSGQAFRASYHFERNFKVNGILLPNPDLKPEKITTLDAQAFVNVGDTKVSANFFQSEQANLIDFGRVDDVSVQQNMPGTRVSRGIEIEARGKPMIGLETFGSVAFTRYWQVQEDAPQIASGLSVPVPVRWDVGADDRATFRAPAVIVKGGASYTHHRGVTGSVFGTWQSASDALNNDGPVLENQPSLQGWDKAFLDLDARVQVDVTKLSGLSRHPVRVGLNARNLLSQQRYEDWGDGMWQRHGPREVMVDVEFGL